MTLVVAEALDPNKTKPKPSFKNFICSPIGLVEKKDPGQYWLIHHESFPKDISVNDGIDE